MVIQLFLGALAKQVRSLPHQRKGFRPAARELHAGRTHQHQGLTWAAARCQRLRPTQA